MRATRNNQETEIKLAVPDVAAARRLLRSAGFRVSRPRHFEANTLIDTPEEALRNSGRMLRIREAGGRVIITCKGSPRIARHKTREELEVTVSSAADIAAIFDRLCFQPKFRYEKYRTELDWPGHPGGIATIDETPIGVYLELEGAPRWIDRAARSLGFSEKDYLTASYGRLYLDWCAREGREPSHMVFAKPAKKH